MCAHVYVCRRASVRESSLSRDEGKVFSRTIGLSEASPRAHAGRRTSHLFFMYTERSLSFLFFSSIFSVPLASQRNGRKEKEELGLGRGRAVGFEWIRGTRFERVYPSSSGWVASMYRDPDLETAAYRSRTSEFTLGPSLHFPFL